MIVMKFGGSSVDTAASIERVVGIVRDCKDRRPAIVVSAMAKTTQRLWDSAAAAAAGNLSEAHQGFEDLAEFHRREGRGAVSAALRPELDARLDPWLAELKGLLGEIAATRALTPRTADAVAAFGELMASAILSLALRSGGVESEWIDCRQVVVTDHDFTRAKPLYGPTNARLREALPPLAARGAVPVLGGFVGSTTQGVTTTLGKEGSDFSAAIVGAAVGADEVLIWTDVDGLLTADPRLFPGARRVRTLSFNEALELACSGAKKPHYGTLGPASRAGVPIRILNSRHAGAEGTVIGRRNPEAPPTIKSIACRTNDHLISARLAGAEPADGFLPQVFAVCETFRPALLVLGTNGGTADLALQRADRLAEIHPALRKAAGPSTDLEVHPGRAVVSLVSEDLTGSPELAGRALAAARDYAPRLVTQGVAAPCVRFLADEADLAEIVSRLHAELLAGEPEEAVE
ncbi:MAG TPA: aspartate kinase [Thermoanaerobaculia bacterium]|nr:aspartate kinase [Thermoanaerobaculia bacterium]